MFEEPDILKEDEEEIELIPHITERVARLLKPGDEVCINHEGGWCVIDGITERDDGELVFEVGANEYTRYFINDIYSNIEGYDPETDLETTPSELDYDPEFAFLSHNFNPYA